MGRLRGHHRRQRVRRERARNLRSLFADYAWLGLELDAWSLQNGAPQWAGETGMICNIHHLGFNRPDSIRHILHNTLNADMVGVVMGYLPRDQVDPALSAFIATQLYASRNSPRIQLCDLAGLWRNRGPTTSDSLAQYVDEIVFWSGGLKPADSVSGTTFILVFTVRSAPGWGCCWYFRLLDESLIVFLAPTRKQLFAHMRLFYERHPYTSPFLQEFVYGLIDRIHQDYLAPNHLL